MVSLKQLRSALFSTCSPFLALLLAGTAMADTGLEFSTANISLVQSGIEVLNTAVDGLCDADPQPGCDYSFSDDIVRTHDALVVNFNYALNAQVGQPPGTDRVILDIELPLGLFFEAIPGYCLKGGTVPPGTSSLTGDGRTEPSHLICDRGVQVSGTAESLQAVLAVSGINLNGAQLATSFSIRGEDTAEVASNTYTATVTATPRWDYENVPYTPKLAMPDSSFDFVAFLRVEEPNGIYTGPRGTNPNLSARVGNERIVEPVTFEFDVSANVNAQLNGCSVDAPFAIMTHPNTDVIIRNPKAVLDAGVPTCTQAGGPGTSILVSLAGTDTTLDHFPTQLISSDYITDQYMASSIAYNITEPTTDNIYNDGSGDRIDAEVTLNGFNPVSPSGQPNLPPVGEPLDNNTAVLNVSAATYVQVGKFYLDRMVADNRYVAGVKLDQGGGQGVAPGEEVYIAMVLLGNSLYSEFNGTTVCDVIDSNALTVTDLSPGIAHSTQGSYFDAGGTVLVEYASGYVTGPWPPASFSSPELINQECVDPSVQWETDTANVNGPITKVRVTLLDPWDPKAETSYQDVPVIFIKTTVEESPQGAIIPNFALGKVVEVNNGDYSSCAYDPGDYPAPDPTSDPNNEFCGARLVLNRANLQIDKLSADGVDNSVPGGTIFYGLLPRLFNRVDTGAEPVTTPVTVTDILPAGMSYVIGSANIPPAINGQTLTWNLGPQTTGAPITPITFAATFDLDLEQGDIVTNYVEVAAPLDLEVAQDERSIRIDVPASLFVSKTASEPNIHLNDLISYDIGIRNTAGADISSLDIIDVLPFNGDNEAPFNRTPSSAYAGTLEYVSVGFNGGLVGFSTVWVTDTASASINPDPSHPSNIIPGGSTTWCLETDIGIGVCPASAADVTAVRVRFNGALGNEPDTGFTLNLQTIGNDPGDLYVNNAVSFGLDSSGSQLPSAQTNMSAVKVFNYADIEISKTPTPNPSEFVPGEDVVFEIVVTNNGPNFAFGLTVLDDVLAPELEANTTWTCSGGIGTACSPSGIGDIDDVAHIRSGGSITYLLTIAIPSDFTGTIENTAQVQIPDTLVDPDLSNNSSYSGPHTVTPRADLQITKTDDADPVITGDNLTYTLTVANAGPSDALGVVVTDTLPAGVTLVGTSGCATDPGGVPTCQLGSIAAGASAQYTVTVAVDSATIGTITNTASVASGTTDPEPGNDSVTEDTVVDTSADLSIFKLDNVDPVVAGNNLTYTLTVENAGPSDALGVVVTDTLPAGVTLVSTSGCATDPRGVPTCDLGSIAAGASAQYTVTVTVDTDTTGIITNTAAVASATSDPEPGNDSVTEDTVVDTSADLSITKVGNVDPVIAGNNLTYTLTVNNAGPSDALSVVVTDTLPAAVTLVSTSGCAADPGGVPTCDLGSIAAGGSAQYTVTVAVASNATGTIINNALVTSATTDPDDRNNSATEETGLNASADISISKAAAPGLPIPGDTLTYTISVRNAGPSDALGIVATETLPAGVTFVSTSGCDEDPNGVPTCTLGTVAAGADAQYDVVVTVDDDTNGVITNAVNVTSSTADPDQSNNSTSVDLNIDGSADLDIDKVADVSGQVAIGDRVTYTITVINLGPGIAENVVVTEQLPDGVVLIVTSGCVEDPSAVPDCTLGTMVNGQTLSYTVEVEIDQRSVSGDYVNRVSVTSSNTDNQPDNNTAVHRGIYSTPPTPPTPPGAHIIDTNSRLGLMILMLLILGVFYRNQHRRHR